MIHLEELKKLPKVIESQIPLLTHFQISEALRATIGDIAPMSIRDWELDKLKEIVDFQTKYAQKKPDLSALSMRLKLISRQLLQDGNGMAPFVLGKDYKPDMPRD